MESSDSQVLGEQIAGGRLDKQTSDKQLKVEQLSRN